MGDNSQAVENLKKVTITIEGKPKYIPEIPGIVRVKYLKGIWQFTPKKNNTVAILYQVHCEPGGNLPSWLVNSVVVDQPYETLCNLKTYVLKEKYQKKKYSFIKEGYED